MTANMDLLLPLYRAARILPTSEFQALALRLVEPLIRFESAVWATGYRIGTALHPALVPILPLSHTHSTDPEGVAEWRQINRADKAIPIMLAQPYATVQIHSPTLFGAAEDAVMLDYTRRFGRQCALVTGLGSPTSPLIEWSVLYRPDASDIFSTVEESTCQRLMLHMSEALRINRLVQRAAVRLDDLDVDAAARGSAAALVTRNGDVLAADDAFTAACRQEWTQFDPLRLPGEVIRHIVDSGQSRYYGSRMQLRARLLADGLWWFTATTGLRVPGRRMNVAALFAEGESHKSIARTLGISPATVRNHLSASYRDFGVTNRSQLKARLEEGRGAGTLRG